MSFKAFHVHGQIAHMKSGSGCMGFIYYIYRLENLKIFNCRNFLIKNLCSTTLIYNLFSYVNFD